MEEKTNSAPRGTSLSIYRLMTYQQLETAISDMQNMVNALKASCNGVKLFQGYTLALLAGPRRAGAAASMSAIANRESQPARGDPPRGAALRSQRANGDRRRRRRVLPVQPSRRPVNAA
jgi:hypothetical protein